MTGRSEKSRQKAATARTQTLVAEALDLLDAHGVCPEAAVHLELALQELRKRSSD